MIKYSLTCSGGHFFDSWFANSKEYDRLQKKKLITCPECDSKNINKSIMAPNLYSKTNKKLIRKNHEKHIKRKLIELRNYVEKNYKFVGERFAEEARSIHYDKKTSKGIYGQASPEQTAELIEEGIEVSTIPWVGKKDN